MAALQSIYSLLYLHTAKAYCLSLYFCVSVMDQPTYMTETCLLFLLGEFKVQISVFTCQLDLNYAAVVVLFSFYYPPHLFLSSSFLYFLNLVNLMPNKCLVKSNPMVWLVGCNLTTRIYGMQRGPRSGRITLYIKSCGSRFSSANQVLSYAPDPHISSHVVQPDCVRSLVEVHSAAMLTIGPVVLCCWRVSFT